MPARDHVRDIYGNVADATGYSSLLTLPQRRVKRLVDLLLAVVALAPCAPLIALIAVAVHMDSPGPALFCQWRVGEGGVPFRMFKFRSMHTATDSGGQDHLSLSDQGEALIKRSDDPRITRVGRWLRRTSLDELPQLFNVLKGDMSLVGPRPELPAALRSYEVWQLRRLQAPQGMTGWWQVNGRSQKTTDEKVVDDLYYIDHYSLWLDVKILLATPRAVVVGNGAY